MAEAPHDQSGEKPCAVWGSVADPGHLLSQSIRNESATETFESPFGAEMFSDSKRKFVLPVLFGAKDRMQVMTRLLKSSFCLLGRTF